MKPLENLYRQIIMDHYKNPKNKGLVDDPNYQTVHIKNPSCGDDITVQTHITDNHVTGVRHDGSGCSICCSSASVLSTLMIGKTVEDAVYMTDHYLKMVANQPYDESIEFEDAIAYQGVRQFPARIKCASIAWQAFKQSIKGKE